MKVEKKQYYFLLLILIATIGVYVSVNQLDFVNWDDDDNVRLNTKIQTINAENITYHFTHERYKSLALYSFMFDYALWKQNPAPYHLHNLLLHLINIVLVFIVVSKLTNNRVVSLITCALFAFHPVSVEAVAWVTGRKDLLFLLFSLLSILVYRKYTKSDYNIWWLLLLSLLVFIASMAKIQAFVLPLVFLAFDYFFKRKLSYLLILEKIAIIILLLDFHIAGIGLIALAVLIRIIGNFKFKLKCYEKYFNLFKLDFFVISLLFGFIFNTLFKIFVAGYFSSLLVSGLIFGLIGFLYLRIKARTVKNENIKLNILTGVLISVNVLLLQLLVSIEYIFEVYDVRVLAYVLSLMFIIVYVFELFKERNIKVSRAFKFVSYVFYSSIAIVSGVFLIIFLNLKDIYYFNGLHFWTTDNALGFSFIDRLLLAGYAFLFYIKRLFLLQPFNPMPAYPEPGLSWSFESIYFVNFILAIIIISILTFIIVKYFKKNRLIVLGILIFLINISIVMHIIPIEGRIVAADRYAYVSFWGLFIVIAYSIDKLLLKYNYLKLGAVSLICVFLAINSYSNVAYWKNSYTLWLKAVSEDKYNSYALNALGIAYLEIKENVDSALIMIDRALNINPNVPEYHVDKGRVLFKLDSLDSALVYFNNAILLDSTNDMAYNNRGALYVKIMQYKNAISDFENAISINNELELYKENYLKAIYFLQIDSTLLSDFATLEFTYEEKIDYVRLASDKLIAQDSEQLALKYLLIGLKVCDNDVGMLQNVATIYSNMGKYNQSISYYKKLLAIFPAHPDYYFYLANNYFNLGDRKNACDNWILAKLYGHKQAAIYFDTYCKKD